MNPIVRLSCLVLAICILMGLLVPQSHGYNTNVNERSRNEKYQPSYWFGPRMGRKKRTLHTSDVYRSPDVDKDQLTALLDLLQDNQWGVIAADGITEGKRRNLNFTPRLGRESGEELIGRASSQEDWMQNPEATSEMMYQRSPPFAPRLGRQLPFYMPRHGRDLEKSPLA